MKYIGSLSLTIVGAFLIFCSNATAQSFSCSFGRPACLGYNDKVVSSSATCFDSYTCMGSFVCKSDLQNVASKYEELVDDYNDLVRRANEKNDTIQELISMNEEVKSQSRKNRQRYDNLSSCVLSASNIDDARNCGLMY